MDTHTASAILATLGLVLATGAFAEDAKLTLMATAKKLLEATELPIGQIATMTGFAWPTGLTNFFRKHSSLSATECRQWV